MGFYSIFAVGETFQGESTYNVFIHKLRKEGLLKEAPPCFTFIELPKLPRIAFNQEQLAILERVYFRRLRNQGCSLADGIISFDNFFSLENDGYVLTGELRVHLFAHIALSAMSDVVIGDYSKVRDVVLVKKGKDGAEDHLLVVYTTEVRMRDFLVKVNDLWGDFNSKLESVASAPPRRRLFAQKITTAVGR